MSRFFNRKSIAFVLVALVLLAGVLGAVAVRGSSSQAAAPKSHAKGASTQASVKNQFCSNLGKAYQASQAAQMYCFGPQPNANAAAGHSNKHKKNTFGSNVDVASLAEDVTPSGLQAYGQSEESVAGTGPFVYEAWNDATGFFAPACSPSFKDQLTGFGFSSDGGKTFTDEGGLPNIDCGTGIGAKFFGDPAVEAWSPGGTAYFYIASLYAKTNGDSAIAMDVCTSTGCNSTPIIIAQGNFNGFLDKDFMSIDPVRGLLYVSYLNINFSTFTFDIDLAVCDIGNGALGGTAAVPVCDSGTSTSSSQYLIVAQTPLFGCQLEGAYPAVDLATGDVYVAYEANWFTAAFAPCNSGSTPVQNRVDQVGFPCITLPAPSPCTSPDTSYPAPSTGSFKSAQVNINSLTFAFIPGYNRFPANDFPRIAVSDPAGTVTIVWNDTRSHALGDILLQSFDLNGLFPTAVQSSPVRINDNVGGLHFLPALRNVDDDGDLQISYYERVTGRQPGTLTDVRAVIDVSPLTVSTPHSVLVTTGPSDWANTSSDIIPNFGDYTDNYVIATPGAPFTAQTLYVAWADGRNGVPQAFEAHAHTT